MCSFPLPLSHGDRVGFVGVNGQVVLAVAVLKGGNCLSVVTHVSVTLHQNDSTQQLQSHLCNLRISDSALKQCRGGPRGAVLAMQK